MNVNDMKKITAIYIFSLILATLQSCGHSSNSEREQAIAALKDSVNNNTFLDFTLGDSIQSVIKHINVLRKNGKIVRVHWASKQYGDDGFWKFHRAANIPMMDSAICFQTTMTIPDKDKYSERKTLCEIQFYKGKMLSLGVYPATYENGYFTYMAPASDSIGVKQMYESKFGIGYIREIGEILRIGYSSPDTFSGRIENNEYCQSSQIIWKFKSSSIEIVCLRDYYSSKYYDKEQFKEAYYTAYDDAGYSSSSDYRRYLIVDYITSHLYPIRTDDLTRYSVGIFYLNTPLFAERQLEIDKQEAIKEAEQRSKKMQKAKSDSLENEERKALYKKQNI
jgi:lipoprotein